MTTQRRNQIQPLPSEPLISYHRGGGETHPLGTRAAYEAAAEQQAEMVEFDVWRAADGTFFCNHDEFDPDGRRIPSLSWPEIEQTYPTISRFADLLPLIDGISIAHIDIKSTGSERALVDEVRALLSDAVNDAWYTTSNDQSVRALADYEPEATIALSLGRDMEGRSALATFWVRLTEVLPFYRIWRSGASGVAVNHQLWLWPLKQYIRLTKRTVMIWTLNEDDLLRRYLVSEPDGIDVVITDRPKAAARIRASSPTKPSTP